MKTKTKIDVKIKNSGIVVRGETTTKITPIVVRHLKVVDIANEIASHIKGKLIDITELYDPKTQKFLTETELKAKGAVFMTISYKKDIIAELNKKSRITKEPTPFKSVIKTFKMLILGNIDWQAYINRRSEHGEFEASKTRSNNVENYNGCQAIGIKHKRDKDDKSIIIETNYYINGVFFKTLEDVKYIDENGKELDGKMLNAHYLQDKSKSKAKEALKHGIAVEFDPQYRTPRMDSCEYIRAFGNEYIPIIE